MQGARLGKQEACSICGLAACTTNKTMSLRARILLYVAAVMAIVFVLVIATLLPDTLREPKVRLVAGERMSEALQVLFGSLTARQRQDLLAANPPLLRDQDIIEGWALVGLDGSVLVWKMPSPNPGRAEAELLAAQHFHHMLSVFTPDGERLVLYTRINSSLGRELDIWGVFWVMVAGTVLLAAVIYQLLVRVVVKPVERLASASRAAAAKGLLPQVPHTDRQDEIGDLVRAYNTMAGEVNDLRSNLERRVAEATRDLEAAQNQILVSERLSAAGRMAAGVAHEVNNPLGGMLNAARTLRSKAAPGSRESEYLDLILEGLSRIQHIMASLLQFSRPAQQASRVDLAEVMESALLFCQYRFSKLALKVEKDYAPAADGSGPEVLGRRAELGQVLLNLLVNALDAMEARSPGPHALTLRLRRDDKAVTASVADTGVGMSSAAIEHAGQLFYSTKAEGKGTGLGLAVAQHIVMQHGGSMKIESTPGQGTTVTVTLPA